MIDKVLTHLNEMGAFRILLILWLASASQCGSWFSSVALAASNKKFTSVSAIWMYGAAMVAPVACIL